jgi:hypothetical protein
VRLKDSNISAKNSVGLSKEGALQRMHGSYRKALHTCNMPAIRRSSFLPKLSEMVSMISFV